MSPQEDKLINLAIHESSDPEILKRNAESKSLDNFNHENEEDREHPLEPDFDITCEDKTAENQINIVNRPAG